MRAEAEDRIDGLEGGEKALCLLWVLEAFHLPFSSACRLMRILGSIVEIATLPVFYLRQNTALCRIAPQLVRYDDTQLSSYRMQQLFVMTSGMSQRQRYCGCGGSDRNISTGSA